MDELTQTDVIEAAPSLEAPLSEGASSAPATEQGETSTPVEQSTQQAEAAFQVPENDDDLKGKENDPQVVPIIQLRRELRERDQRLDSYKPLEAWKPIAEAIPDPALAQSSYELVSKMYTPLAENPSGFTTRPALEQLESQEPGTIDQIFADICSFVITGPDGKPTTVVRELYRSHGLDPDAIDDYRNIGSLRASGVVTPEQLEAVPEKYRDAYKTLSPAVREDLLSLKDTNPLAFEEYLRNANDAFEVRRWREQDAQAKVEAQKAEDAAFEQQVTQAVEQHVVSKVQSWTNSIHQNLSSQWKPSSDEAVNNLEYAKVMSVLATLQNPAYRFVAENALKSVGASLDGFDDLVNQWQASSSAYVAYEQAGQQEGWPAKRALSESKSAEQRLLIKLNDYALKLGQVTGNRLATQSQQTANQLATASARFVPNGNGQAPQGSQNPYMQNPHPVGTQEYYAFNRKIDKEFSLNGASVFS